MHQVCYVSACCYLVRETAPPWVCCIFQECYKLETEVHNWLTKYDDEMDELQVWAVHFLLGITQ